MADDPRKYLQDTCGPVGNPIFARTRKRDFFRTLGKVGDLEVFNRSPDGTKIGQGLRTLETISNQIRLGQGAPRIFQDPNTSREAGQDAVLNEVGIDPVETRRNGVRFNPAVANRALGQADAIYERVRQGNFEMRDIPEAIQDFKNLAQLLGGIFTPLPGEYGRDKRCGPSPYARDLIALAPKHKFMFVTEYIFSAPFQAAFNDLDFAFVVKRTTRPNINFEYEDVNYYNFRTKALKRSEYQPMTMTFYDDMRDHALRFYNNYLQLISPVSRSVGNGSQNFFEEAGMSFDPFGPNSASTTAVGDTAKTIIDFINIYHIIEGGKFVDVYRFDNPKIQSMQLDDLDMADGNSGTEVTIEFIYDGLLILPRQPIEEYATKLTDLTDGGIFPIKPRLGTENIVREITDVSTVLQSSDTLYA